MSSNSLFLPPQTSKVSLSSAFTNTQPRSTHVWSLILIYIEPNISIHSFPVVVRAWGNWWGLGWAGVGVHQMSQSDIEERQRPGLSLSENCDRIYGSVPQRGSCRAECGGGGGSRLPGSAHPPPSPSVHSVDCLYGGVFISSSLTELNLHIIKLS